MMRSGYPEQYRQEVLEDSIVGYQRQVVQGEGVEQAGKDEEDEDEEGKLVPAT